MQQQKILLLENVATQAAGVREHLTQAGFQVAVSRYEADGLKRLVEWDPDLVLVSTAHPAGEFVDYCRRVRALAPAVRIVVTSSLGRDRLFHEHLGLSAIVDGVLQRPYRTEEVVALLASVPEPLSAPAAQPTVESGSAELRAEFQRQLDARFLEVEELKRHLEVATRRAASAPGLEWLQSENEHLRQGVEEARKKAALALATEQLKRSEIEVKLDNLLRMKEDFEFRAQNELEERSQEIELARGQLRELRESTGKEAGEHATLRAELERALVEKEQIEERLHALETGGTPEAAPPAASPADGERIAALEAELSRQRALAAEGQLALADCAANAAILEETLAREPAAREERERLHAQAQALREEAAEAQRLAAEQQARNEGLRDRLAAAESSAAEARTALAAADEGRAGFEKELSEERQARAAGAGIVSDLQSRLAAAEAAAAETRNDLAAATERRQVLEKLLAEVREARAEDARLAQERANEVAARQQQLLERAEGAEGRVEQLQSARTELEERLAASDASRISVAAEAEAVVEQAGASALLLAADLERERAARAAADQRASDVSIRLETAKTGALSEAAVQEAERLNRELAAAGERARELTQERDGLKRLLEERRQAFDAELLAARERAEAAARELELQRAQQDQRVAGLDGELAAERERSTGLVAERELQLTTLRGELVAAGDSRSREARGFEERLRAAVVEAREARSRLEIAEAALGAARDGGETRERELLLQLEALQASSRELEEKFAARPTPDAAAAPVPAELHRIQELLEEVISRARTEAVEYARRDAELSVRLQAALDERRLLQERFDRASAEATERERRSSSLLQSAIDHGPVQTVERANLPAVVPLDPVPAPARSRRAAVLMGLAVAALAALLAFFGLRQNTPPAVPERRPALPRPQPGVSPGAAATPREVWDRWTRSDGSGGVLVQATLRSEQELRAEVEADRARGMSDEEARAELARRSGAFRFDTTWYVTVYLKNLAPGYPAYLDDLPGRFRLRDGSGKEVPAFLPPGHEKDRRIFSFGAGAPGELFYEASVSLGFDRAGLTPTAGYLQLVVSDVGAASRRVLTWELE